MERFKEKIFPIDWKEKEKIRECKDEDNKSFYILNFNKYKGEIFYEKRI